MTTNTSNSIGNDNPRAKSYWRHKHILALAGLALSIIFLLLIQYSGISAGISDMALAIGRGYHLALLIYLCVFGAIVYALSFPLGFYEGFILERKFSLSNQRLADWLKDEAKSSALSALVFLCIIEALYTILASFPHTWWIVASAFWIAVSLLLANIFPIVVLPLFYKYNALSKNELRQRALELASRFGIKVIDIFEIDFSKKTKKANAAVIGWGNSRRIIMADNLVNDFPEDEALVVLAHEMAHHRLRHIWKLFSVGAISTAIFFFALSISSSSIASGLGVGSISDISIFPTLYLLFIIFGLVTMPIHNAISRKLETDADIMAIRVTGKRDAFISLMERLGQKNLADVKPNRVIEFLLYSHPSISKRIDLARKMIL